LLDPGGNDLTRHTLAHRSLCIQPKFPIFWLF
jgi:hypothetical protein